MDYTTMSHEELVERRTAIGAELEVDGADLNALETEVNAINAELERRAAEKEQRDAILAAVAQGAGDVVETIENREENKTMTNMEIRNSPEYIEAFARYIKSEDDRECRALLTENASGDLPVPEFVDGIINTAWENEGILSRVRRVEIRGNLKVAFEISASPAVAHTEGTTAVTEESLSLGIVTLLPKNIKKMIHISDEAAALGGEAFIRYVYAELAYQITKLLSALVVGDIAGASTSSSSSAVGVPAVTAAPAVTTIPTAAANLSDEADGLVVIMNRLTEVAFLEAHAQGNFGIDPFAGLPRVYSSALPAYSTANANAVYAIVGDLKGETVNFPEGAGIVTKWDDLSEAEADLVKIVARQYAAHGVTGPGRFCNIKKPAAVTT